MLQIKNHMLFHFNHKDICSTLNDINQFFEAGKEYGKTENELCNELGVPKELVTNLLKENICKKTNLILPVYTFIGILICVSITHIYNSLNPLFWCIPTVIIPTYIWHICGGMCLFEIQYERKNINVIFYIPIIFLIVLQQTIINLLHYSEQTAHLDKLKDYTLKTFYLTKIFIIVALFIFTLLIYQIYHAQLLSICNIFIFTGAICSSFAFITYVQSFNGPSKNLYICALPCIISGSISLFFFRYLHKKEVK